MRTLQFIILTLVMALCCGCQPLSSPWAGTPYEPPQAVQSPGQATFAPTPDTPMLRFAPAVDTASQDAAIERYLLQQSKPRPRSGEK